jgi:hairless
MFLTDSDDNSSIQSSPWQRDHCWKQSLPRRNISKEMCLYFHRPSNLQPVGECLRLSKKKSRRPQDKFFQIHQVQKVTANAVTIPSKRTKNETIEESKNTQNDKNKNTQELKEESAQDGDSPRSDEKIEEKAVLNGKKPKLVVRETLASVVKKLSEKNPTIVSAQNARMSQLSISNHHHVSPRKRFLRELEKVSLEDKAMKRSRAKTSTTISCSMATIHSSANIKSPGGRHTNGNSTVAAETISLSPSVQHTNNSRPISSYSITSLLGHNSDSSTNKNGRKEETSPLSASHQHKDFEQNRNMKSSPEQISQKMFSSVVAMSAGNSRKRASPIYHPHSPSPISSEQSKQSSNLSSSPEQHQHQQQHNMNKYRQHPYIYNPLHSMMGSPSVSSPNYTINPRYSPSPNAENYSQKFRSNYLTSSSPSASYNSSPSHQLIKRESPVSTSSPTTLSGGRKSPSYSAKYVESPTHQTNFNSHFGHYQSMVAKDRDRDLSPSRSPKKFEKHTASTSTSSSGNG